MKEIVGLEPVSYTSKAGNLVTGTRIYYTEDAISPAVGKVSHSEFISGRPVSEFRLGAVLAILYEPGYGNSYRCVGVLYKDNK